jgi:osmotically-inducible protein OsmY
MHIHSNPRFGRVGALLGCTCLLAVGCASDQETRRRDPSAREVSHDPGARAEREHERDRARAEHLDDHDRVPDATGEHMTDESVGKVEPVAVATPNDASGTDADRQVSARIRKAIEADDALSANAKNVTVQSSPEEVTLRGSVATSDEKTRVESHAQRAAGSRHVNNELVVKR